MNKLLMEIIPCHFVLFSLFASFNLAVAQEKKGTSSTKHLPENEVVIHSPIDGIESTKTINQEGKENNINSDETESLTDLDDTNVTNSDEMHNNLEKEKERLEELEKELQKILNNLPQIGGIDEDENENKGVAEITHEKESKGNNDNDKLQKGKRSQSDDSIDNESTYVEDEEIAKVETEENESINSEGIKYDNPFDSAEVFYGMGEYKKALKMYKSLAKNTPNVTDFIWAQFQIANCYRNVKELDKAAKEYQNFINKYPDSFWADQASWYIEDVKWWKKWNKRVRSDDKPLSLSQKTEK